MLLVQPHNRVDGQFIFSAKDSICDAKHWLLGQNCGQKSSRHPKVLPKTPQSTPQLSDRVYWLWGGIEVIFFYLRFDQFKVTPSPQKKGTSNGELGDKI